MTGGDPMGGVPAASARALSVTELAARVRRVVEGQIGWVRVVGEISNLRQPRSGHCYFLLKDADAAINAVCFRLALGRQTVRPSDGLKVELTGRMTVYPPRSEYQIIVETIREAGLGDLMRRLRELRERLRAEGIFDLERKRPIPRMPRRIGIVTSPTGAALRDILNVLGRRTRGLEIILSPAAVQGEGAPLEIVAAIGRLARQGRAEVIIAGRGGGSIEDLWAFNDERVVRAIAASPIPVISAVGHETDTTLADEAADLRAPTPSAAAELVSASHHELDERLASWSHRLERAIRGICDERRARLVRCAGSWGLPHPRQQLALAMQRLDDLAERLRTALPRRLRERRSALEGLVRRWRRESPAARIQHARAALAHCRTLLDTRSRSRWRGAVAAAESRLCLARERLRHAHDLRRRQLGWRLESAARNLVALDPHGVLRRGYSIVTHGARDRVVTDPARLKAGEAVRIRSAGGRWRAAVLPPDEDMFDRVE